MLGEDAIYKKNHFLDSGLFIAWRTLKPTWGVERYRQLRGYQQPLIGWSPRVESGDSG